jgi:hypothetical protein
MDAQVGAQVVTELEASPRGSPAQNVNRMVYEQARLNGLGARAAYPEDAHVFTLQVVKKRNPRFTPSRDLQIGLDECLESERFVS